jgi:ribonuclease HI
MMVDEIRLFTDGASRGNPGPAAVAYLILTPAGAVLAEHAECIGHATNNQAEYRALLLGLRRCAAFTTGRVRCEMDSSIVVNQLTGTYRTKHPVLIGLREEVRTAAREFADVSYRQRPRSVPEIARADALANEALDGLSS